MNKKQIIRLVRFVTFCISCPQRAHKYILRLGTVVELSDISFRAGSFWNKCV